MYFKVENQDDAAKVQKFLKKEGITHEADNSCHEIVVKEEVEFLRNGEKFDEIIEEWELSPEDRKIAEEMLNEIFDEVIEDAQVIVQADCSFLSVQEAIEDRIREEVIERFIF